MKRPTTSELLFSLKCFAGSMLALYLALLIGLPRPFWAMMTAYVVASPFSGTVRSKAVYRVAGTVLGSIGTVLLVPSLSNAPELLSLMLAFWVGACLYISLLDRTPRSYVFMLAGYTAALIGFPAVAEPASVFDVALARVEEITLGITCATLIHTLVFPQSLGQVLMLRIDRALDDAQHWIKDVMFGRSQSQVANDRRILATDVTDLRLMATHLPFDTSHLRWTSDTVHALQDRMALLVPILSAVDDRLQALEAEDPDSLQGTWHQLRQDIVIWMQEGKDADPAKAEQFHQRLLTLAPTIRSDASWSELLQVNLASRMRSLINTFAESLKLRRHIHAVSQGAAPSDTSYVPGQAPSVLHRDHGMALRSAIAAVVSICVCCAFWILTAWPAGSGAAMMAAVFCCFFASQDDPVPGIKIFLHYTIVSIPISAFYLLVSLPVVNSFDMLVLVSAPIFLILGVFIARPATTAQAMATLFGVAGMLSMHDTNTADMASFINSMLAQLLGISAAAVFSKLLRSVSAQWAARRLLHAGWSELIQMIESSQIPSVTAVTARMLDRIALLTPRLAMNASAQDHSAVDALNDLRVGLNIAQLRNLQQLLALQGLSLESLMDSLAEYFRSQYAQPEETSKYLLTLIDRLLHSVCRLANGDIQRDAVTALTSIRRDLFPLAASYQTLKELP
ncbi:FUSC family protein [Undibacterium sp. SXout7W]|uniref:FUSC family protein n=1 Tax=Undibacterium sp. SXout7W TaxID=3413049 RepID=UPI003BF23330